MILSVVSAFLLFSQPMWPTQMTVKQSKLQHTWHGPIAPCKIWHTRTRIASGPLARLDFIWFWTSAYLLQSTYIPQSSFLYPASSSGVGRGHPWRPAPWPASADTLFIRDRKQFASSISVAWGWGAKPSD